MAGEKRNKPQRNHKRKTPENEGSKPHKPLKKPRNDAPAAIPASILDDDPDFPRGGRSLLSGEEVAEARAEAEDEFQREEKGRGRSGRGEKSMERGMKRKRGRLLERAEDDAGSLFGAGITGKLPKFANRITWKNISATMKLWGVVAEVNPKDLVISLPGGLKGFVRAEEVSDDVISTVSHRNSPCDMFHVGQLVSCIVLQVDDDYRDGKGAKRIWLSLRLSLLYKGLTVDALQSGMALTAQVKSVEDHGYILHFGVTSFSGFSPKDSTGNNENRTGCLMQGVVTNIDKTTSVVYLNPEPEAVAKCITKDLKGLSIDQLVPGMMVNARVQAVLNNGLLLSFLTYFSGTVDIFHLQNSLAGSNWKDDYAPNKKVNARVLFIDPSTRAIGLTLNSHLIHNKAPPICVRLGDVYDHSRVVRIDRGAGLLLEIPSDLGSSAAYVSIFDMSDDKNPKLEKKFKEGSQVRLRVLGYRHSEGLATGSLKASAFEEFVVTHSDVKPGMLVRAKVISVENFGAIVQFASGVKALCPLPHMSEFEVIKPSKKFKVGAELLFRVLGCKSKRITVTHKKTLLKSKLAILASYTDAVQGLVSHGWIAKIEKHGCFVRFYNGVQGFAHRSELGLDAGIEANAIYHVGQVVKCRVINSVPSTRRIGLSFLLSSKRNDQNTAVKIGSLVSGVVERLTATAVIVHLNKHEFLKGSIPTEHLADQQGQATILQSLLKPGYEFDQLLVLDLDGSNIVLSAKYSLINSIQDIPSDAAQIRPSSIVHGYVCNVIETGCFVRFFGRLTGFSPKSKATDEKIENLSDIFFVGQSVRSRILNVNSQTGHIKLSLKQSSCFSTDVSFIHGYFLLEEKIAALHMTDNESQDLSWVNTFSVGSVVEGEIQEITEFGVVLKFKYHADIVGFITQHQLGGYHPSVGSVVKAFVLDVLMSDNLVDLSIKTELVKSASPFAKNPLPAEKKGGRTDFMKLALHQTVNASVEIVKDNYLVLSIPDFNYAIGYASITDFNTQKLPSKQFIHGQSVIATVGSIPSPESSGRLLLSLNCLNEAEFSRSKRAKKKSTYNVGALIEGEIIEIKPLELILKFGLGFRGRLHITEVTDNAHFLEKPFSTYKIGQVLNACIIAKSSHIKKSYQWELSIRYQQLTGSFEASDNIVSDELKFSVGEDVNGFVVRVDTEWLLLTISRNVNARIFILDSSSEPHEVQEFQKRYSVGQVVKGRILNVNKEKKVLRLKALESSFDNKWKDSQGATHNRKREVPHGNASEHIFEGDVICGKIKKIFPGVSGLLVQIGPHLCGKVHYTELLDTWVSDPLSGYHEGQFVKCKVLEISRSTEGYMHVDLSLRASLQGENKTQASINNELQQLHGNNRIERLEDIFLNMDIQGYVKNINAKGCFMMLSRAIDARILISNLSDGYVQNPEKEFHVGKLVNGKVLHVDIQSKRVDVTLKTGMQNQVSSSASADICNLHVEDIIVGIIRRIESYGLFIEIKDSSLVGLCHISELSDDPVNDIQSMYEAGDRVVAKILKIDEARQRISLGLKNSYIRNGSDGYHGGNADVLDSDSLVNGSSLSQRQKGDLLSIQDIYVPQENDVAPIHSQADLRASVPPLQVSLDQLENSDEDVQAVRDNDVLDNLVSKVDQRKKKKAKEARRSV